MVGHPLKAKIGESHPVVGGDSLYLWSPGILTNFVMFSKLFGSALLNFSYPRISGSSGTRRAPGSGSDRSDS